MPGPYPYQTYGRGTSGLRRRLTGVSRRRHGFRSISDQAKTLLIIHAESEQAIVARLAEDPSTPMGLLHISAMERWEVLLRR